IPFVFVRSTFASVPSLALCCTRRGRNLADGILSEGILTMSESEIDAVRALLGSKPRPVGWHQRRQRIEEVGSVWPAAGDITFEQVDIGGLPGEWSMAPGSDASRVLMFFHGGGFCSGSILSHRRLCTAACLAAKARTPAIEYRLGPGD